MNIMSLNCHNGLGKHKATIILKEFPKADILVIQECKREDIYAFDFDWKFKNWYGDDLEYSDLGIAVFSNSYDIEFSDVFNRKYRYVVPYTVKTDKKTLTLFAVWTKPVPYYYDENVTKAVYLPEYKELISSEAIIIGDFNTGHSEEHPEHYSNLCKKLKGFKNCTLGKPEELMETFYSNKKKPYLNDFCFFSESLYTSTKEIKIEIHNDWKENSYGQKSWRGISDHCPIVVDFDF
jgi:exonuclease III